MVSKRPAKEPASDTSDDDLRRVRASHKRMKTLLKTKDTEIAQLCADLQAAVDTETAKDQEITRLCDDLMFASDNAADRESDITKLREQVRYAEQALKQEIKKGEDAKRLYTVHGNTQHFSRQRVEELEKANEELELELEKVELQQWLARERGARGELEELKKCLFELSKTP